MRIVQGWGTEGSSRKPQPPHPSKPPKDGAPGQGFDPFRVVKGLFISPPLSVGFTHGYSHCSPSGNGGAIHTMIADPKVLDQPRSLSFPRKRASTVDPRSPAFAEDKLRVGDYHRLVARRTSPLQMPSINRQN